MVAAAVLVTSRALVAVTVYMPGLLGGWYVAEVGVTLVKVPLEAVQVTPWLVESFGTVAENFNVWESVLPPRLGEMCTVRLVGMAKMVIVTLAEDLGSATGVAGSVTVAGLGGFAG